MVRTQTHLIEPMNLGLKLSRLCANRWIFFLEPFPYRSRILFVRSAHRLLWGQSPGSQVASHRSHGNLQSEFPRQQLLHGFPGPQRQGQAQLVRGQPLRMWRTAVAACWGAKRETGGRPRDAVLSASHVRRFPPALSSGSPYRALLRKPVPPRFAKGLSRRPEQLAGEGLLGLLPAGNEHPVFPCPHTITPAS